MQKLFIHHNFGQLITHLDPSVNSSWILPSVEPNSILLISDQGPIDYRYTLEQDLKVGQSVAVADKMGVKAENICGKLVYWDTKNVQIDYNHQGCRKTAFIHDYNQISTTKRDPYINWLACSEILTLSYLLRQISWSLDYFLFIDQQSCQGTITAKTQILNQTQRLLSPNQVFLVSDYDIYDLGSMALYSHQSRTLFQQSNLQPIYILSLLTKQVYFGYFGLAQQYYPPANLHVYTNSIFSCSMHQNQIFESDPILIPLYPTSSFQIHLSSYQLSISNLNSFNCQLILHCPSNHDYLFPKMTPMLTNSNNIYYKLNLSQTSTLNLKFFKSD